MPPSTSSTLDSDDPPFEIAALQPPHEPVIVKFENPASPPSPTAPHSAPMQGPTDLQLRNAFGVWFQNNLKALLRRAHCNLRSDLAAEERKKQAEDLLSNAIEALWKECLRKRELPPIGWAKVKIGLVAIDKYKRDEYRPGFEQIPASQFTTSDDVEDEDTDHIFASATQPGMPWIQAMPADPATAAVESERSARLHAAIDSLALPLREVVNLRYFCYLSVDEIATRLNIDRHTVTNRTNSAFAFLRSLLSHLKS